MEWRIQPEPEGDFLHRGLHPIVAILLAARGLLDSIKQQEFLFPDYDRDLHNPFLFRDMEKLVERVRIARERKERVGVFADFDADGVTASVILREALSALGLETIVYIPHKVDEGHGLNRKAVDFFVQEKVGLFFTLDCGMMNHTEIEMANTKGLDVIIVDHHHVPEILPAAYAIINPKIPTETYPFRELCGAGTTFKVAVALYERFLPDQVEQLKWLLDVAAVGTVADVMSLTGENRVLVKFGLLVLQKTRRIGFREMATVGRIPMDEEHLPDAETISFALAPRINAASRMAHAKLAHDLLMETETVKARSLALELEAYNVARQKVSQATTAEVRTIAESRYADKKFIFAVSPDFAFGVIGLVAGRIASEFGKPTCILTRGEETSRGSFRSIPGFSVIKAIEECSDLLEHYGGHEQAAGMTIRNDRLDVFYERFNALAEERLMGRATVPYLDIDLVIEPEDITLELERSIQALAPFGEGNPEPVFALRKMTVLEARTVGKEGKHWKLALKNGGTPKIFDAVGWSLVKDFPSLRAGDTIDTAFRLRENHWNGTLSIQLVLLDIRMVD